MFTTRPEIQGTLGVCASTHWIASAVGMGLLERGGNAFDAAAAMGFTLQILEPHLCGPGGDMPVIFSSARTRKVEVMCAQGVAPANATIAHYKSLGLDLVPGSGLLATVVPGVFDGWMTLLRDHGTMSVRDVLEPAIHYACNGHPLLPRVADEISRLAGFFKQEWPSSAKTWLVNGSAPAPRALFRNLDVARTYEHIAAAADARRGSREKKIQAARDCFYRGFVSEAVGKFLRNAEMMDASGKRNKGVLSEADMDAWQATYEKPATVDYHGWRLCKTGPWGQGPVLCQTLKLLDGTGVASMPPAGAEFIHTVTEAMKLAFADREAYYGDPDFVKVPLKALLSDAYNDQRRKLIGPDASRALRPGVLPGFADQVSRATPAAAGKAAATFLTPGQAATTGEPTNAQMREAGKTARSGDTVHIDVIDRWGNMVSATPSGGWLQSSPVVPGLGFPLNSRAQMFWLEEGLPGSLAPGKRPRTTLSPSLALHEGRPALSFGTPGGDQQDQWQAAFFLRLAHHGLNLQEAIDLPMFHTAHFPASFYPRGSRPGHLHVEESFGAGVIADLRRRGHDVETAPAWSTGRLTAASRGRDGILRAAATPRLMQAYAVGR